MKENALEDSLNAKGLNAPRLRPGDIDRVISDIQYHVFPGTTSTVCAITLSNGYVVIGHSAAASPTNFDEEIGRQIAFDNARNQIWGLEGYLLKQRLADGELTAPAGD